MAGTGTYRIEEGLLPFAGGHTWYRTVGEASDRPPILLLHGGPGFNSEYLEPFEALAATGRRVVRYDQIGAGRSTMRGTEHDPAMFTIELFRRELVMVRDALGLDEIHLVGQSWGCMLALEHALSHPPGLRSLVLESGLASVAEWNAETDRLRSELPAEVRAVLDECQRSGTIGSQDWTRAYAEWELRHVLRLDPPPPWEARAAAMFDDDSVVYDLITGGAEFATGRATTEFDEWDVRDRLGAIDVPTLLLSGRFDEATPAVMGTLHRGIQGAEWQILEESSHSCHSEETARTIALVADFLARVDTLEPAQG